MTTLKDVARYLNVEACSGAGTWNPEIGARIKRMSEIVEIAEEIRETMLALVDDASKKGAGRVLRVTSMNYEKTSELLAALNKLEEKP